MNSQANSFFNNLLQIIVVVMVSTQQAAAAECKPLLVMYGGAWDEDTETMKSLARDLGKSLEVAYYSHSESNLSRDNIKSYLRDRPSSPIVLLGHSWGGDTAYGVASDWGIKIQLLGTLDAVGGRAYPGANFTEFKEHLRKPSNVEKWRNVWIKPPGAIICILGLGYFWNWNNCVADTGAPWGYQKYASNVRFRGDHTDVYGMLEKIRNDVISSLACK